MADVDDDAMLQHVKRPSSGSHHHDGCGMLRDTWALLRRSAMLLHYFPLLPAIHFKLDAIKELFLCIPSFRLPISVP